METIYFEFNGRKLSGYILSSNAPGSDYYWFVFNDEDIAEEFGDTIAFHIRNSRLEPVYSYHAKAGFIEFVRNKVEAALSQQKGQLQ